MEATERDTERALSKPEKLLVVVYSVSQLRHFQSTLILILAFWRPTHERSRTTLAILRVDCVTCDNLSRNKINQQYILPLK